MRHIILILSGLLLAVKVHAQLNFLSDNRSISVSGWMEDSGGNMTQSYAQTNYPAAPFADFNAFVSGGTDGSSSSASQNSGMTSQSLSSASRVTASVATGSYGAGYGAQAGANSEFQVSFEVQQPLAFNLSGYRDIESLGGVIDFELNSSHHGNIVSWSGPSYNNNYLDYSGMLQPDDYTLEVQEYFSFSSFGDSYDGGSMNYNMILSVPEPAALGPFLILTWFGMVALKRKLA